MQNYHQVLVTNIPVECVSYESITNGFNKNKYICVFFLFIKNAFEFSYIFDYLKRESWLKWNWGFDSTPELF